MAGVYTDDPTELAESLLGPGAQTYINRETDDSLFSTYMICWRGNEVHIYVDGTRNQGQLLAQAYSAFTGPRDYGTFTASELYHTNATRILRQATALGLDACHNWVLVGHSYGGATAAVMAAILRENRPSDIIAVMTMGAPKAGGEKLIRALRRVCQRHYHRPRDPIPYLPPQRSGWRSGFSAPFNAVGVIKWLIWGDFFEYEYSYVLYPEPPLGEINVDLPDDELMSTIALQLEANVPINSYEAHAMYNYANELARVCGLPDPFGT